LPSNKNSIVIRFFGDLRVRPKLMVLHNVFFLVLACAVYFSLIPLFEKQVADAQSRESTILHQTEAPGQAPNAPQLGMITQVRLTLFLVLGSIYVLAVVVLESVIMPLYVYHPLRKMLEADEATQRGDRTRELIPDAEILKDEIGQIMRSRNATVAELRRQEDELAAALHRLEEQDRLVSLGLLAASVAHELNTPLAVLNGSIEKLIETTGDASTLERLERMQRVAQRLRRISESLVDFSRVRKQNMGPIALRPLIDEAWSLVAIDDKASKVAFTNHLTPEDKATGNADRMIQVFVNLLRNALNAVEAGSGQIDVRAQRGARGITIAVEDNGTGIAPEVLPGIFDAFVSTKLDAKGTGLGLTVAEGIVTQHGGSISARNRKEGGARLEVTLPAG